MSTSTSSTDLHSIEETVVDIPGGNDELVDESSSSPEVKTAKNTIGIRKLSTFSKKYDVNGDGVLDDAEMAMRGMDTSGRGYLTNDKVHALMLEEMKMQKQLFRTRRIALVLLALVVILAVANLGTSFAAASLAKDTTTSSSAELADKTTHDVLSTQTSVESIELEPAVVAPDGRRRLCASDDDDVECLTESFHTISATMCDRMIGHCSRGNTVNLKRTWTNGDVTSFNVCPFKSGTISVRAGKSKLKNSEGEKFAFERIIAGGACRVSGDALAQELGEICEVNADCGAGAHCKKDPTRIAACKDRCDMLRFAPSRLPMCYDSCDHATCQASSN
jgi:hypothetical protein